MTMTSRRSFTFASLAMVAGAASAQAGEREQQATPRSHLTLGGRWSIERTPRELVVALEVTNLAEQPVDLLVKRGSGPGPTVTATLEVEDGSVELAEVLAGDRRELLSRIGPIPRYQTLASGADVAVGPWRFVLPEGSDEEPVCLVARLVSMQGTVELRTGPVGAGVTKVAV